MSKIDEMIDDIKDFHMNPFTRFTREGTERKERKMKSKKRR